MNAREGPPPSWIWSVAAGLAPAIVAAGHLANVVDAARDREAAWTLGSAPDPTRSLDVIAGGPFAAIPIGTDATRAGLGGALVLGATGVLLFRVARHLLRDAGGPQWIVDTSAWIGAVLALVGFPWQAEATGLGGAALGALMILAAVAGARERPDERRDWALVATAVGLACCQGAITALSAAFGCAASVAMSLGGPRRAIASLSRGGTAAGAWKVAAGAAVGLAPLVVAVRVAIGLRAAAPIWTDEQGPAITAAAFLTREVGIVPIGLAIIGLALGLRSIRTRATTTGLGVVIAMGFAGARFGEPWGPDRFEPALLAALAATGVLTAVAVAAVVRSVAAMRLPLAPATAAMVVLLELAIPVQTCDDASARRESRPEPAGPAWDDFVWGLLEPRTVLMLEGPRALARASAARVQGSLRSDITLIGRAPAAPDDPDPALRALWRDVTLTGGPTEATLSALADLRPVAFVFAPSWARDLARHAVPLALLEEFAPEPRGPSDRRLALQATEPWRARLASVTKHDPDLRAACSSLLGPRVQLLELLGERDLADMARDDLRTFGSPSDK